MSILSNVPNTSVIINNADSYKLPAKAEVVRSKENLDFTVLRNDSIISDTLLKPKLSDAFWLGNFIVLYLAPVGWLVDLHTDKRFTYGKYIFIDSLGNVESYQHLNRLISNKYADRYFHKYKKGSANFLLAIPEATLFHLRPKGESAKNLGGFLGIGTGFEYFYKNNKSLQLRCDGIMDFIAPFPAAFDPDPFSPRESCYALNINLSDNFHINRFQLGYGLNYAKNTWVYHGYREEYNPNHEEDPKFIEGRSSTNQMLGLAFNAYYRFANHFYIGLIYRPSFVELSNPKLMYEHSISLDFMMKIGK